MLVYRVFRYEVGDRHLVLLAHPVNTILGLGVVAGVPATVEEDRVVRVLEVLALAHRADGADQDSLLT